MGCAAWGRCCTGTNLVDVCDELLWAAEVQGAERTHKVAAQVGPLLVLLGGHRTREVRDIGRDPHTAEDVQTYSPRLISCWIVGTLDMGLS